MKTRVFASMFCSVLLTFAICPMLAAKRRASTLVDIVPITTFKSQVGCPVSAWIHPLTGSTTYLVNFRKLSSGQIWMSGTTNPNNGKVSVTVPFGFKVYAEVPSLGGAQSPVRKMCHPNRERSKRYGPRQGC